MVELWGLPEEPVYAARMKQKQQLAHKCGVALVEMTAADLSRLEEVFDGRLAYSADGPA